MAPGGAAASSSGSKKGVAWTATKVMNVKDLSRDDDYISHLLVEKLGVDKLGTSVPLQVHRMDNSKRLPKTDAQELLQIVRRLVAAKGSIANVARAAVDELLQLTAVRYFIRGFDQKQINAFATHASRYFELYHPSGSIEIAHTSRYSHRTGKSELCILATRPLAPGMVISELKGSMATLSEQEDKDLKRTDLRASDIRRDFSVIHSKQMKKNHLFLGPARFVNHDCDNNCEIFREGRYITFRVLRPIVLGQELTAHYGAGYFGRKNRHCLCETCEKRGHGGYAPDHSDGGPSGSEMGSDSGEESDAGAAVDLDPEATRQKELAALKINERRTRRGVYATLLDSDTESEESEAEEEEVLAKGVDSDGSSDLSSLAPEHESLPTEAGILTPASSALSPPPRGSSSSKVLEIDIPPAPFRASRRRKAQDLAPINTKQLQTPPLTEDTDSLADSPRVSARQDSASTVKSAKAKGKERAVELPSALRSSGRLSALKGKEKAAGESISTTSKGKGKEKKVEEPKRNGRPALLVLAAAATAKVPPAKKEAPRDPDGKLLPLCATCENVLPFITVDSQPVHAPERSNRGTKPECPRCMRHFAIYGHPWPVRMSVNRPGYAATPREDMKPADTSTCRVSQKILPVLDQKLSVAVSVGTRRSRRFEEMSASKGESEVVEEPPLKRRRTTSQPRAAPLPPLRIDSPKVTSISAIAGPSSSSAKCSNGTPERTGRRGRPRKYAREPGTTPPPPKTKKSASISAGDSNKRKRGRPRKSASPVPITAAAAAKSGGVYKKKRTHAIINGLVVKKEQLEQLFPDGQASLSRAERAAQRGKVRNWLEEMKGGDESDDEAESEGEGEGEGESRDEVVVVVKEDPGEDAVVPPAPEEEEDEDGDDVEEQPPAKRARVGVLAVPSYKGVGLLGRPNPMSLAAKKTWIKDEEIDTMPIAPSSKFHTTPSSSSRLSSAPPTDEPVEVDDLSTPPPPVASPLLPSRPKMKTGLGFRPNPMSFSRRPWVKDEDKNSTTTFGLVNAAAFSSPSPPPGVASSSRVSEEVEQPKPANVSSPAAAARAGGTWALKHLPASFASRRWSGSTLLEGSGAVAPEVDAESSCLPHAKLVTVIFKDTEVDSSSSLSSLVEDVIPVETTEPSGKDDDFLDLSSVMPLSTSVTEDDPLSELSSLSSDPVLSAVGGIVVEKAANMVLSAKALGKKEQSWDSGVL